tara:strand:+ start:2743 stop:3024 length:282 start_codon:yes stop_codon:yes gene_type:complete
MTKQQVYDGTLKKFVEIEVDIKDSTEQELLNKTSTSKNRRNQLLTDSDWTSLTDNQLTDEQKAEAITYRQALRDLPEQEGFPDVDFPTKPDFI